MKKIYGNIFYRIMCASAFLFDKVSGFMLIFFTKVENMYCTINKIW